MDHESEIRPSGHLATDGLAERWISTIRYDFPFPVEFAKEHFSSGVWGRFEPGKAQHLNFGTGSLSRTPFLTLSSDTKMFTSRSMLLMLLPAKSPPPSTPICAQDHSLGRRRGTRIISEVCRAFTILIFGISTTLGIAQQEPNPVANPATHADIIQRDNSPEPEATSGQHHETHEQEALETDRDSFTPATRLAGTGRLILEAAYTFMENREIEETHSFPEMLLRYGLSERLELRLGWNHEVGASGEAFTESKLAGGNEIERESRLSYGIKMGITQQDQWIPRSALILTGLTPTSGRETATQIVGTYVVGWELPNDWECNAAIRYGTVSEEGDHFGSWAPSFVLKAPMWDRWNAHIEYFSIFSSGRKEDNERHFVSPGVHYLINPNLEVGVRVGWGLNDESARFFTNVGIGWSF